MRSFSTAAFALVARAVTAAAGAAIVSALRQRAGPEVVADDGSRGRGDEHGARLVDAEVALQDAQAHESHECQDGPDSFHGVVTPFRSTVRSSRWESKAAPSSARRAQSAR